jgi:cytosine/adenosine deaminase-related metal-dependent hydrolase
MPPAVIIEPVETLEESVTSVEEIPAANGIRAVVAVCPSFVIAVDRPVAKSAVRALKAVEDMTVPVTTG